MWDLPDSTDFARAARAIHERGGAVAAVCHGPAALVNITLSDGSYLVAGTSRCRALAMTLTGDRADETLDA